MSDTPRRPWFQIHLSTAVVMMLVASVLLWANVRVTEDSSTRFIPSEKAVKTLPTHIRGWPLTFSTHAVESEKYNEAESGLKALNWKLLVADICWGIAILAWTARGTEWLLRRREGRAP